MQRFFKTNSSRRKLRLLTLQITLFFLLTGQVLKSFKTPGVSPAFVEKQVRLPRGGGITTVEFIADKIVVRRNSR